MIILSERDLGVVCDGGKCTGAAVYIVTVYVGEVLHRLYCPQCTAELLQRCAKVLCDNNDDRPLHNCIETELLMNGGSVNA